MTIINSTFYGNTATFGATYPSAVYVNGIPGPSVVLKNTIIGRTAGSMNVNCRVDGGIAFSADSYNVADDSSCAGATNSHHRARTACRQRRSDTDDGAQHG